MAAADPSRFPYEQYYQQTTQTQWYGHSQYPQQQQQQVVVTQTTVQHQQVIPRVIVTGTTPSRVRSGLN